MCTVYTMVCEHDYKARLPLQHSAFTTLNYFWTPSAWPSILCFVSVQLTTLFPLEHQTGSMEEAGCIPAHQQRDKSNPSLHLVPRQPLLHLRQVMICKLAAGDWHGALKSCPSTQNMYFLLHTSQAQSLYNSAAKWTLFQAIFCPKDLEDKTAFYCSRTPQFSAFALINLNFLLKASSSLHWIAFILPELKPPPAQTAAASQLTALSLKSHDLPSVLSSSATLCCQETYKQETQKIEKKKNKKENPNKPQNKTRNNAKFKLVMRKKGPAT